MNQLATLPDISTARLPATYEAARHALSECSKLDECQQWADKAEALASYAKQAKDESLRKLADRIQARAIRRAGELLKMVEPQPGARTDLGSAPTRGDVATAAGMSEHQRKTALRVASVPAEAFEAQVESDEPPTITALAEQGKRPLVDLGGISTQDFKHGTRAIGELRDFAKFAAEVPASQAAAGIKPHERESVRQHIARIDAWLDQFIAHLE